MRLLRAILAGALLGAPCAGAAAEAEPACPDVKMPALHAPHLRAALARHEQAIIVALGSSSTRGWQSSDPAHSYPAVLQSELTRLLPHAHVAVINRGVNGEDVTQELPRLESDALVVRPQLVIWQIGANGALHSMDPAAFRALAVAGVAQLHKAGVDVVLMDNQRSPRLLAAPEDQVIDHAVTQVAEQTETSLFDRGALMDAWAAAGDGYGRFIAPDKLHHNDLGYRCLGEAVAAALVAGLGPTEPGGKGPGSGEAEEE